MTVEQRCTVINPDGTFIAVANLNWLLRWSYKVDRIVVVPERDYITRAQNNGGPAVLTAHLTDDRSFVAMFASFNVCMDWIHARQMHRRRLAHVTVVVEPLSGAY